MVISASSAKEKTTFGECPKCNGKIVEKRTKRGKIFYGCDQYPKCDFASWDKPILDRCPICNGILIEKKNEIQCLNCDYRKEKDT